MSSYGKQMNRRHEEVVGRCFRSIVKEQRNTFSLRRYFRRKEFLENISKGGGPKFSSANVSYLFGVEGGLSVANPIAWDVPLLLLKASLRALSLRFLCTNCSLTAFSLVQHLVCRHENILEDIPNNARRSAPASVSCPKRICFALEFHISMAFI